jgi:hypothetical protein
MAADEISAMQNEQTLAMQQVAPWASSAQCGSPVASWPTDAISCESDAADAAWSSIGTRTKPDVEIASTSSNTSQRLKPHVAGRGIILRCHVPACNMRYVAFSLGLRATLHVGCRCSFCIDLDQDKL